jgi:diketogulonate reductase-like aldo/keto reductase
MNSLTECYQLSNGVKIPCVGFGTWQAPDGETTVAAVKEALALGYRHIDTAAVYGNEESVGRAVKESGIPREEIFITSKLWNSDHGYEATLKAFAITLSKLGLDYLDLYLIHWPNPVKFRNNWKEANADTWKAFEKLYKAKKIRSIGISNFRPHHIEALLKAAAISPMVNQIRLCPGETQPEVVKYCQSHQILLEAYSPLGTGRIFDVPEMKTFVDKYQKSIAQVCLRWSLQMGYLPLPKSLTAARIKENTDIFDFELSATDVRVIAGLTGCCGLSSDPDTTNF